MQEFEMVSLDKLQLGTEVLEVVEETGTSVKSQEWSRARITMATEQEVCRSHQTS